MFSTLDSNRRDERGVKASVVEGLSGGKHLQKHAVD